MIEFGSGCGLSLWLKRVCQKTHGLLRRDSTDIYLPWFRDFGVRVASVEVRLKGLGQLGVRHTATNKLHGNEGLRIWGLLGLGPKR